MGLSINRFYKLTPRSFDNILKGYRKKESDLLEVKMTLNRDLEFAILSPYFDSKKLPKNYSAKDWKPFIWETKGAVNQGKRVFKSKEDLQKIFKKDDSDNI